MTTYWSSWKFDMVKCQTFFVSGLGLIGNLDEKLGIKKIYECQAIARVLHIEKDDSRLAHLQFTIIRKSHSPVQYVLLMLIIRLAVFGFITLLTRWDSAAAATSCTSTRSKNRAATADDSTASSARTQQELSKLNINIIIIIPNIITIFTIFHHQSSRSYHHHHHHHHHVNQLSKRYISRPVTNNNEINYFNQFYSWHSLLTVLCRRYLFKSRPCEAFWERKFDDGNSMSMKRTNRKLWRLYIPISKRVKVMRCRDFRQHSERHSSQP